MDEGTALTSFRLRPFFHHEYVIRSKSHAINKKRKILTSLVRYEWSCEPVNYLIIFKVTNLRKSCFAKHLKLTIKFWMKEQYWLLSDYYWQTPVATTQLWWTCELFDYILNNFGLYILRVNQEKYKWERLYGKGSVEDTLCI